jgi:hypothetical protein
MAVAGIELRVDIGNGLKVTKALTQQTKQLESAVNGTTQALTKQGREVKTAATVLSILLMLPVEPEQKMVDF